MVSLDLPWFVPPEILSQIGDVEGGRSSLTTSGSQAARIAQFIGTVDEPQNGHLKIGFVLSETCLHFELVQRRL